MQQLSLTGRGTRPKNGTLWRWLLTLGAERVPSAPEPTRAMQSDAATPSANAVDDFEGFYQRHEGAIFGYLWRICGDEQAANDLTQEVFFRAWKQFEKLRGYERPDAWLFRVATNLALNERRRQRTAGPTLTLVGSERAGGDHAAQLAERAALRAALERLPAKQRAAFILRESYGHSCEEIATILGLSLAAAKMTLSRARQQLRALYLKESAE